MGNIIGLPWRLYPYVVAYGKSDQTEDIKQCETRKQAQDFVRSLSKEFSAKVFKLNPNLLYFRAGRPKRTSEPTSTPVEESEIAEHPAKPTDSFI